MKPVLAFAACLTLAACLQAPAPGPTAGGEQSIAPDRLLLAYFDTGVDEPPGGGVIRACPQASSGLCVSELGQFLNPLEAEGDGWRYSDSGGNVIVLNADGTGRMTYATGGGGVGLTWTTEVWSD